MVDGGVLVNLASFVGRRLAQTAIIYAFASEPEEEKEILLQARKSGYLLIKGRVGSMESEKIINAVEVAAQREGLIDPDHYREEHALYHAALEALTGVGRGLVSLRGINRTTGLTFVVARGPRHRDADDGEWLAVVFYGTIGAPRKGFEHETLGLGINHV